MYIFVVQTVVRFCAEKAMKSHWWRAKTKDLYIGESVFRQIFGLTKNLPKFYDISKVFCFLFRQSMAAFSANLLCKYMIIRKGS